MRILLSILLFIISNSEVYSQSIDLINWRKDTMPTGDRIYSANQSNDNWIFKRESNSISVIQKQNSRIRGDTIKFNNPLIDSLLKERKGFKIFKRIEFGYIVALNQGEFGGSLYFIAEQPSASYLITSGVNIREFFELGSKLFAIEGLHHSSAPEGKILEIYKDTTWKFRVVKNLNDIPYLVSKIKDHYLILTSGNLQILSPDLGLTQILKAPFDWKFLYPSDLYVENDDIYIGMRKGVLQIKSYQTTPIFYWFVPK